MLTQKILPMKDYASGDLRNVAIVGHAKSGKTMLAECLLASSAVINRLGSIESGTTVSDYLDAERQMQLSINASLLHTEWAGRKFNFIDTPGYLDFLAEAMGALRVTDTALVVLNAMEGVEVGTMKVWEWATECEQQCVLVLNGLDKEGVDFDATLQNIRIAFGAKVAPVTIPLNPGPGFNQVLDVVTKEVVTYVLDGSGKSTAQPAQGDLATLAETLHGQLIELAAEVDDTLIEKYFQDGDLTKEELHAGLIKALRQHSLIPLFATSATTNVGVTRVMEFLSLHGASPLDHDPATVRRSDGTEGRLIANGSGPVLFIFKTLGEAHLGDLSFFKLFSGRLQVGQDLQNVCNKHTERVGQIFLLNGHTRTSVDHLTAGDIGALVKMKHTHTCDTLCGQSVEVTLPPIHFPHPNIHAALKLKGKGDEEKIAQGLAALHAENPMFLYHVDSELHQTVISGQGELHLRVVTGRLKERYHVDVELGEPKVAYRETIRGRGESRYRHKKQTGGSGQFAEVWMRVEPRARDTGVEFVDSLTGMNVDRAFVPSVEKGVKIACTTGVLAGYRVVDVRVDFYDGKTHPVDSKDVAFQLAGKHAFREAFLAAKPCLLEPVFRIEVKLPDAFMGVVMGDLNSRRGKILGIENIGGFTLIRATVPARDLYRYSTHLRSTTEGRGIHTEEFDHYQEMPHDLEIKIIAEAKKERSAHDEE